MQTFTNFISVHQISAYRYALSADLTFEIGKKGSGFSYAIPMGFDFDVSIPRPARLFFNPNDFRYLRAAAIHDHMLINGWDRQTADAAFYRALRASYVPAWRAVAMFLAVTIFSLIRPDPATLNKGAKND